MRNHQKHTVNSFRNRISALLLCAVLLCSPGFALSPSAGDDGRFETKKEVYEPVKPFGTVPQEYRKAASQPMEDWKKLSGNRLYRTDGEKGKINLCVKSLKGEELFRLSYPYYYAGREKRKLFSYTIVQTRFVGESQDGNLYFASCTNKSNFFTAWVGASIPVKTTLVKCDSTGNVLWQKNFPKRMFARITAAEELPDGTVTVTGSTRKQSLFSREKNSREWGLLVLLSETGEILKKKQFEETFPIRGMQFVPGEGYLLYAYNMNRALESTAKLKKCILRLDEDWNVLWKRPCSAGRLLPESGEYGTGYFYEAYSEEEKENKRQVVLGSLNMENVQKTVTLSIPEGYRYSLVSLSQSGGYFVRVWEDNENNKAPSETRTATVFRYDASGKLLGKLSVFGESISELFETKDGYLIYSVNSVRTAAESRWETVATFFDLSGNPVWCRGILEKPEEENSSETQMALAREAGYKVKTPESQ